MDGGRARALVLARSRDPRTQRGAAAVEFALVVPLLVLLLFGIISYGYMLSFRQAMSQGAAEGARAAAVAPVAYTDVEITAAAKNAVNEALGNYGVTCDGAQLQFRGSVAGTCSITIAACSGNVGRQCASVALDYHYRDHAPIPSFPGVGLVLPSNLAYASAAEVS